MLGEHFHLVLSTRARHGAKNHQIPFWPLTYKDLQANSLSHNSFTHSSKEAKLLEMFKLWLQSKNSQATIFPGTQTCLIDLDTKSGLNFCWQAIRNKTEVSPFLIPPLSTTLQQQFNNSSCSNNPSHFLGRMRVTVVHSDSQYTHFYRYVGKKATSLWPSSLWECPLGSTCLLREDWQNYWHTPHFHPESRLIASLQETCF